MKVEERIFRIEKLLSLMNEKLDLLLDEDILSDEEIRMLDELEAAMEKGEKYSFEDVFGEEE